MPPRKRGKTKARPSPLPVTVDVCIPDRCIKLTWEDGKTPTALDVINRATEHPELQLQLSSKKDLNAWVGDPNTPTMLVKKKPVERNKTIFLGTPQEARDYAAKWTRWLEENRHQIRAESSDAMRSAAEEGDPFKVQMVALNAHKSPEDNEKRGVLDAYNDNPEALGIEGIGLIYLTGTLEPKHRSKDRKEVKVRACIDTGCLRSSVSWKFAKDNNLDVTLSEIGHVYGFQDVKVLGEVKTLAFKVSKYFKVSVSDMLILEQSKCDVLLGLDWLTTHDWTVTLTTQPPTIASSSGQMWPLEHTKTKTLERVLFDVSVADIETVKEFAQCEESDAKLALQECSGNVTDAIIHLITAAKTMTQEPARRAPEDIVVVDEDAAGPAEPATSAALEEATCAGFPTATSAPSKVVAGFASPTLTERSDRRAVPANSVSFILESMPDCPFEMAVRGLQQSRRFDKDIANAMDWIETNAHDTFPKRQSLKSNCNWLTITVRINDCEDDLCAVIDTGTTTSLISAARAERSNCTTQHAQGEVVGGGCQPLLGKAINEELKVFDAKKKLATIIIKGVVFMLVDKLHPDVDVIIGLDFLIRRECDIQMSPPALLMKELVIPCHGITSPPVTPNDADEKALRKAGKQPKRPPSDRSKRMWHPGDKELTERKRGKMPAGRDHGKPPKDPD
eukprot:m.39637 g.39637  ORF g.39637 m.39637 type:complete len:677 (+) comp7987_c0_seq2:269-2299(+)